MAGTVCGWAAALATQSKKQESQEFVALGGASYALPASPIKFTARTVGWRFLGADGCLPCLLQACCHETGRPGR